MSASPYPSTYSYAPDDLFRIKEKFKKLGKEGHFNYCLESIEWFASSYIDLSEWGSLLPDRQILQEKHEQQLRIMEQCRQLIIWQCQIPVADRAIPELLSEDPDNLVENRRAIKEIVELFEAFDSNRIAGVEFLNQMAVRALDYMINDGRDSGPAWGTIKDGRERRHRRAFIENVSRVWAELNDCDLRECTISAVDGSPMLEFIKACLDPLTAITGEAAGNETIKNIVNQLKRELLTRERFD
ncbi:hypothetical protein [Mesorhizobium sp. 10J20-29]